MICLLRTLSCETATLCALSSPRLAAARSARLKLELQEAHGGEAPLAATIDADSEVKVDGADHAGHAAAAPRLSTARRRVVCVARTLHWAVPVSARLCIKDGSLTLRRRALLFSVRRGNLGRWSATRVLGSAGLGGTQLDPNGLRSNPWIPSNTAGIH